MAAKAAISDLFHIYDIDHTGCLTVEQLHQMYSQIRIGGISLAQVINYTVARMIM